jgi:hypothetical protein
MEMVQVNQKNAVDDKIRILEELVDTTDDEKITIVRQYLALLREQS